MYHYAVSDVFNSLCLLMRLLERLTKSRSKRQPLVTCSLTCRCQAFAHYYIVVVRRLEESARFEVTTSPCTSGLTLASGLLVLALCTLIMQSLHDALEIFKLANIQAFLVELRLLLHCVFLIPLCDFLQLQLEILLFMER